MMYIACDVSVIYTVTLWYCFNDHTVSTLSSYYYNYHAFTSAVLQLN